MLCLHNSDHVMEANPCLGFPPVCADCYDGHSMCCGSHPGVLPGRWQTCAAGSWCSLRRLALSVILPSVSCAWPVQVADLAQQAESLSQEVRSLGGRVSRDTALAQAASAACAEARAAASALQV